MKITGTGSYALLALKILDSQNKIHFNKKYQRGFVWSERFKRDLIISLLKGYPIGSIIIKRKLDDEFEVVDGQQRIKTILSFLNESLSLNATHGKEAKQILLERWNGKEKYKNKNSVRNFSDLVEIDQINIQSNIIIPFETIEISDDQELKAFFNKIQNQEKVTAGEIISNLPFELFEHLKEELEEVEVGSLKNIGFDNKRNEFLKILIANYGISINNFHLGYTDDEVIKLSNKIVQQIQKDEINEEEFVKSIKSTLAFLQRIDSKIDIGRAKKRFVKLFMLITNNLNTNSKLNIKLISLINQKLSILSSSIFLTESDRKDKFIKELISLEIISKEEEFGKFIELHALFSKTKTIDAEKKKLIEFWTQKVTE